MEPECTLRAAITEANKVDEDRIVFDIPTTDPRYDGASQSYIIALESELPDIRLSLTID